ncbi:hypothetical protein PZA11_004127 [Diplocarpon coronariae]|uniref:Type 1 phosphatases regulator n=1 Tax=Diplocarpon coronariae TaxID=2795749 RepID=A0A218Z7T2_9HELO|nr:hypothetical protein JHW43_003300 [Diplocarpon mali]OWP04127.1 hypothetical protein B2J93_5948 [Marssonina coronariae]
MEITSRAAVAGPNQAQTDHQTSSFARETQTTTQTTAPSESRTQPILHLRGAPRPAAAAERRIQWAEDVIDNEGLNRKKSKVCCIYHAPKGIDESSDESESDESDSDSGDEGGARPAGGKGKKRCANGHDHGGGNGEGSSQGRGARKRSPNAYERVPKVKK